MVELKRREIRDLPLLGQGFSDFRSLDDVLSQAADMDTTLCNFAFENTHSLRDFGHGSAAERRRGSETYEKVHRSVDPLDWKPAMHDCRNQLPA